MITTFSDHRCLAVNRYTETAPKQRNSRVNTQTAPKMVLKSITANGKKLHFYVRYTSYTYHKQDFQLDTFNPVIHLLFSAITHRNHYHELMKNRI